MRHALTIHPRDVRRHLSAATAVALVAAIPVAAVDVANVATFVRQNRQYAVEATQSDVTVSYTHLDVYKRQAVFHVLRGVHREAVGAPSVPDFRRLGLSLIHI